MPGTAKILGSNLTRISLFKQVIGQFFVCLSVVGFVVTSGIVFFFAARCFFKCCVVFGLLLQFVILFILSSYFLFFSISLKKFLGPNYFGIFFIDLMT